MTKHSLSYQNLLKLTASLLSEFTEFTSILNLLQMNVLSLNSLMEDLLQMSDPLSLPLFLGNSNMTLIVTNGFP